MPGALGRNANPSDGNNNSAGPEEPSLIMIHVFKSEKEGRKGKRGFGCWEGNEMETVLQVVRRQTNISRRIEKENLFCKKI